MYTLHRIRTIVLSQNEGSTGLPGHPTPTESKRLPSSRIEPRLRGLDGEN